jgi:predicted esterase
MAAAGRRTVPAGERPVLGRARTRQAAVEKGLETLGSPKAPLVLMGHSRGARLAAEAAAFLDTRLVIAIFPGLINAAFEPDTNLGLIPHTADVDIFVGDRDTSVGTAGAIELDSRLTRDAFPDAHIHRAIIRSRRGFVADHGSVYDVTPQAKRAIWDQMDALISAVAG